MKKAKAKAKAKVKEAKEAKKAMRRNGKEQGARGKGKRGNVLKVKWAEGHQIEYFSPTTGSHKP